MRDSPSVSASSRVPGMRVPGGVRCDSNSSTMPAVSRACSVWSDGPRRKIASAGTEFDDVCNVFARAVTGLTHSLNWTYRKHRLRCNVADVRQGGAGRQRINREDFGC